MSEEAPFFSNFSHQTGSWPRSEKAMDTLHANEAAPSTASNSISKSQWPQRAALRSSLDCIGTMAAVGKLTSVRKRSSRSGTRLSPRRTKTTLGRRPGWVTSSNLPFYRTKWYRFWIHSRPSGISQVTTASVNRWKPSNLIMAYDHLKIWKLSSYYNLPCYQTIKI